MKVSIFLPVYRSSQFLEETLQSLQAQTYQNFEILVFDDGADDSTLELLKRYPAKIKVISNGSNRGVGHSYLRFLNHASGQFLAQIGHDDVWTPTFLEKMVQRLSNSEVTAAFSRTEIIDEQSKKTGSKLFKPELLDQISQADLVVKLFDSNFLCAASSLVKASELKRFTFPGEIDQLQDWLSWLYLSLRSNFLFVPEAVALYRVHGANLSLSGKRPLQLANELAICRASLIAQPDFARLVSAQGDAYFQHFSDKFLEIHSDSRAAAIFESALRCNALELDALPSYRRCMAQLLWGEGEIAHSKNFQALEVDDLTSKRVFFFLFGRPVLNDALSSLIKVSLGPLTVLSLRFPRRSFTPKVYFALCTRKESASLAIERVLARRKLGISDWKLVVAGKHTGEERTLSEDRNLANNQV